MFKNLRVMFVLCLFLVLSGCSLSTSPYATSSHTIYKKVAQQADPVVNQEIANPVTLKSDVVDFNSSPDKNYDEPIKGSEKIIMRADAILNSEKQCHKIMTLGLAISQDYSQVITSLKNRAYLIGGNAIAVLKLYEDHDAFVSGTTGIPKVEGSSSQGSQNVSGLVANIYQCI